MPTTQLAMPHAHAAMMGSSDGKKGKTSARVAGSACAGALELIIFHPVDTVAKRLMSSKEKYVVPGKTAENLNRIIFRQSAAATPFNKFKSLFPGLGFAAGYKIAQRVYKFGGQPYVVDLMEKNVGSTIRGRLGEKQGKSFMHAAAGSVVGVGEIALLPLDVLKIKAQTNPDAFKNLGQVKANLGQMKDAAVSAASAQVAGTPVQIGASGAAKATAGAAADAAVAQAKPSMLAIARSMTLSDLYRGAAFTAARNAPGSFALFGASQAVHQNFFHLEDSRKATFYQNFIASIAGATASISVAQPFDIVKTRLQNTNFGEKSPGGVKVFSQIVANEGPTALFKGITPKLIVVGPKLIFSFTIAQTLIARFERTFK